MTNYQLIKTDYTLPKPVYYRTLWLIRDLPRLQLEANAMLGATPTKTETPEIQRQRNLKAEEINNVKYAALMKDIRAIDKALKASVPPEDRAAILQEIVEGKSFPINKSKRTYGREKQKFIYSVAKELHYI